VELQAKFEEFNKRDVQLLSVTIEAPERNKRMREKAGAQFEILSDEAGKLIDHFGMRHVKGKRGRSDLAQSSSFLLDQEGRVLWQRVAENYRVRPKPEEILTAIDRLQP
jgi:peroxiredoxin